MSIDDVMSGDTLRQLADVRTSDQHDKFDRDKKKETLKQLRGQFENGRKLFNFALVNASKYELHKIFFEILNNYNSQGAGLAAASKVVEVGTSSMTAEERKRFESVIPRRGRGGYNNYNASYGGGAGRGTAVATATGMDKNTALRTLGIEVPGAYGQSRAVCYNCQKVGHFAKHCPEPPKIKRAREDPE